MTHGSLFSGVGGFDLAAQWMGWENVLHCEINPFGRQVLKHYWPNAISYEDITKTDFTIHRGRIDILTGGFPCQPFSLAGKRKGTEDERHLWPEMLRAIREIQPRWVVGENVYGLVNWDGGLVFEQVQADLENEGYEVQPYILPAASVNAPHRRDRVWFVAFNADSNGRRCKFGQEEPKAGGFGYACSGNNERIQTNDGETRTSPNPEGERGKRIKSFKQSEISESKQREPRRSNSKTASSNPYVTNTDHNGSHGAENGQGYPSGNDGSQARKGDAFQPEGCGDQATGETSSHSNQPGLQATRAEQQATGVEQHRELGGATAAYPRNKGSQGRKVIGSAGSCRQERHKQPAGRVCPDWDEFPTQPPVRGRNDGVPAGLAGITVSKHRNESIKAYGNAIVPQVVYQIFKAIQEYETPNMPPK